jgi:hypothetical protein
MAKFKCTACPSKKEYNDVLTTRFREGEVMQFDADNNRIDICECGAKMTEVKTKTGFGGFVKGPNGGSGNFKRS